MIHATKDVEINQEVSGLRLKPATKWFISRYTYAHVICYNWHVIYSTSHYARGRQPNVNLSLHTSVHDCMYITSQCISRNWREKWFRGKYFCNNNYILVLLTSSPIAMMTTKYAITTPMSSPFSDVSVSMALVTPLAISTARPEAPVTLRYVISAH